MYPNRDDPSFDCVASKWVYLWEPNSISTYVLPVYQIEDRIKKLIALNATQPENTKSIIQQVKNWESILSIYRSYTSSLLPMLSSQDASIAAMVNAATSHNDDIITMVSDLMTNLGGASILTVNDVATTFSRLNQICESTRTATPSIPSYCSDFVPNRWQEMFDAIDGACSLNLAYHNGSYGGTSNTDQYSSPLLHEFCLPKSLQHKPLTILKDPTSFLSFGANSPIDMKYTSKISDSLSIRTAFRSILDSSSQISALVEIGGTSSEGIVKELENAHTYDREVHMHLGDSDEGKSIK